MSTTVKIRVDTWRPGSIEEVNRLLDQGWEVDDVSTEKHESCHEASIPSDQTVFYILRKRN